MNQADQYPKAPSLVTLTNGNGMQVSLMDWGATWLSCQGPLADGRRREVLLGCAQAEGYDQQTSYLGAMIGRYANRIAKAHLPYPGGDRQVVASQGENCLHGGLIGFDKRRWAITQQTETTVCFTLDSWDGEQGFPGNLKVAVTYALLADNRLSIRMQATTDALTPVNLTNHAYFNLDGAQGDIRDHHLQVAADQMLPTDGMGIPFGELRPVAGGSFDFRDGKRLCQDFLADEQQQLAKGYDHSFLLSLAKPWQQQPAARLVSGSRDLTLNLFTSLPALQLYTGNYLAGTPARDGGSYADYQGVALEPQLLPDSPHHPHWPQPSCWLAPGERYEHEIQYQFVAQ